MQRLLPLAGGRNFRDLGGYATGDGRRVAWGRLYRSGVMSYLTDQDLAYLAPLGIRVICDFRSSRERKREPTRWVDGEVSRLDWDYDMRRMSLNAFLEGTEFSPEVARATMVRLYRQLPRLFQPQFTELFARLADGQVPLLFNCSAGKDRTGLAAALVLASLDVPRELVMQDYVLTDSVVDLEQALFRRERGSVGLGDDHSYLARFDRQARAPFLQALPQYLDAAFAQIETDHGSLDAYLRDALRVSDRMRRDLRELLLEG